MCLCFGIMGKVVVVFRKVMELVICGVLVCNMVWKV